ncbi:hypothetical protein MES5069_520045 [Mesorhizobium escarrei]|uniref:Uncharacterized protein n=1 Tax=Mesorhizobium escarrei TaxID=666018 RepID=A0ABM9EAS4_9HYPH|nr:hypothetical protein MES5069_520045 [Mesorhizobium escarrei]
MATGRSGVAAPTRSTRRLRSMSRSPMTTTRILRSRRTLHMKSCRASKSRAKLTILRWGQRTRTTGPTPPTNPTSAALSAFSARSNRPARVAEMAHNDNLGHLGLALCRSRPESKDLKLGPGCLAATRGPHTPMIVTTIAPRETTVLFTQHLLKPAFMTFESTS